MNTDTRWRGCRWAWPIALVVCTWPAIAVATSPFTRAEHVSAVLDALKELVPLELRTAGALDPAAWDRWNRGHDRAIRERLARGDDDTIVNWLLFGTSFTAQPRALLDRTGPGLPQIILARTEDLIRALAAPGEDERRLFAVRLIAGKGYGFATAAARARTKQYLLAETRRVALEQQRYARELETSRRAGDASEEFGARSKLFRDRGVSLDTSMLPGLAIERALEAMRDRGELAFDSVHRAAVLGPGLDFSDKASGYDSYPLQTLQPFALVDSLVRLGLTSTPAALSVTTFDISQRVNGHLGTAIVRAKAGRPYVLRLPIDRGLPWTDDVIRYWKRAGDRIGTEESPRLPPPAGQRPEIRGVLVRPDIVARISPEDFNVVTQSWTGPMFDLIVATNVFVYYDTLDQSLALATIQRMLKPGGFLLSNSSLLEIPAVRMRSVSYQTTRYSDAADDGDQIVWYKRVE